MLTRKSGSRPAHIGRLRQLGQDRRQAAFADAKDIALGFLSSYFSDGGQAPARAIAGTSIHWPRVPERLRYALADRDAEFRLFLALVSGQSRTRALLLHGPSDRGKSVLLAEFFTLARELPGIGVAHCELKTARP